MQEAPCCYHVLYYITITVRKSLLMTFEPITSCLVHASTIGQKQQHANHCSFSLFNAFETFFKLQLGETRCFDIFEYHISS